MIWPQKRAILVMCINEMLQEVLHSVSLNPFPIKVLLTVVVTRIYCHTISSQEMSPKSCTLVQTNSFDDPYPTSPNDNCYCNGWNYSCVASRGWVHGTSINLHLSQWTLMYLKMASMLGKSWQLSCNPMLKVKKQAVHTDKSVKQNRGRGRLQILFLYTQDIFVLLTTTKRQPPFVVYTVKFNLKWRPLLSRILCYYQLKFVVI